MADITHETALALQQEWDIQLPDVISEESILKILADRVVQLIEKGPETFYQLMYRLDISERKLNGVMREADIAEKIARLIYERQLQKIQSRQAYKNTTAHDDPELEW